MDLIQIKQALKIWLDADPARRALPYSEIARACGLEEHASHRSLRRWAAELIDAPPEPTLEEPSELEDDLASYQQDYFYSVDRDTYVFNLTAYPKPLVLSGEIVRRIQQHYSRDGANATIEEMSRSLGWSRSDFEEVRKALGLTHASLPLTPEQIAHDDESTSVNNLIAIRSRRIEAKAKRREWEGVEADAQRWRDLQGQIGAGRCEWLEEHARKSPAPDRVPIIGGEPADYAAVVRYADVHMGKRALNGGYELADVRRYVMESTRAMIRRLAQRGLPERIILTLGDDFTHVDGVAGTTTRGTPQDMCALPHELLYASMELQRDILEAWRQLGADIEVRVILSNHGRWADYATAQALAMAYAAVDGVEVHRPTGARQYTTYGASLIGFAHGDGLKLSDAPSLMSMERARDWHLPHRYFFTGDKHHLREMDAGGVLVCQAPSPSPSDRWHEHAGYVGSKRGFVMYVLDRHEGMTAREMVAL